MWHSGQRSATKRRLPIVLSSCHSPRKHAWNLGEGNFRRRMEGPNGRMDQSTDELINGIGSAERETSAARRGKEQRRRDVCERGERDANEC
jgi:hypothetical protein